MRVPVLFIWLARGRKQRRRRRKDVKEEERNGEIWDDGPIDDGLIGRSAV